MAVRAQDRFKTLRCSFCNKTQDEAGKLICSPSDYERAYICDDCIPVCANAIAAAATPSPGHGNAQRCSFCHKGSKTVRLQPSPGDPPKAFICEECLAVCMSILEDDSSVPPSDG